MFCNHVVKTASVIYCIAIAIVPNESSASDHRWIYDRAKRSLVYAVPETDDYLVEFVCKSKDKILGRWYYARDDRPKIKKGQKGTVVLIPSDKEFMPELKITGRVDTDEINGWYISDGPTNADSILFKFLRWGGDIRANGNGTAYLLSVKDEKAMNTFQASCGS